ncbi:MAG: DNA polymerase I, partial [Oscillospiraceae bacterium]|nr:DNA polymerase I [Oscillospiraceae bacterium]
MKLLAVDGNSIMNRAYYGIRLLTNKEGIYTNAVYGFMTILLKMIEDVKPDAFAFAFDLRAPTFRHKMYADYKAGRKGMPDELAQQMPIIKEILTNLGMCVLEKEGYEADDILGTLARFCDENGAECVIATGDRDSFQLISENVNVRLASTKMGKAEATIYDVDKIKEVYHTTPQQIIDIKAIMGDASDHIPGVAGIGEKGAISLIEQFGSLDYIYDNIDDIDVKDGIRAKLKASKEMAKLSYELAKINKFVPLKHTLDDLKKGEGNQAKVATLLRKLEMYSILERLGLST